MTLSSEYLLLIFGVLAAVGLLLFFQIAAILGVFAVIGLSIWGRGASAGRCAVCGAAVGGSARECERGGHEAAVA